MFAAIETNGASHIVIHVPHNGAEKSLPALARMLEENATFVQVGYQEMKLVKPAMSITLGEKFAIERSDEEIVIKSSGPVLGEDFQIATPEVFVSNLKARQKWAKDEQQLRTELSFVKQQLEHAKAQLEALTPTEDR